jgi:structural maintenance of chromosome 4
MVELVIINIIYKGSGKSNLIESLLFVFGKKANWMRLGSLH